MATCARQQPERPGRRRRAPQTRFQRRVDRDGAVRRHEDQQEADQDDEIEVVEVVRLFEQEDVGEGQEEEHGTDPVPQPDHDEEREDGQGHEVEVHPDAGPRPDPLEPGVGEGPLGTDPVALDPAIAEIAVDLPEHDRAEEDPEGDEHGDVDRRVGQAHERVGERARRRRPAGAGEGKRQLPGGARGRGHAVLLSVVRDEASVSSTRDHTARHARLRRNGRKTGGKS